MADTAKQSSRWGRTLLLAAVAVGASVLLGRQAASFYVDVLWFQGVGYLDVFWTRTLWAWGVRIFVAGTTAVLVLVNLRIVASTLGSIQIKRRFGNLEISEQLPESYVAWAITGTALLMGIWFGAAVPSGSGLQALLFIRAPEWGLADPILGRDASFYTFVLPLLAAATSLALVLVFLIAALSVAGYAATGSVRWTGKKVEMGDVPRLHMAGLLASFILILASRFWLSRYTLLLDGNSGVQGIFGFADAQARLPAYQTLTMVGVLSAGAVAWGGLKRTKAPVIAGVVAVAAGVLLLGQVYPGLVQRFRVEPNELARETPYIRYNLEYTRRGFGLDRLQRVRFPYRSGNGGVGWDQASEQFVGLPVWPSSALLTTFREIEARFRYYEFPSVAVDRYQTPEGAVPVAISVREIDPQAIEDPNWQNLHLRRRYMTGMGAVAVAVNRATQEGRPPMYLSGIPPEFPGGPEVPPDLELDHPEVYIGSRPQTYSVINPALEEFARPDGEPGVPGVDFPPGIALDNPIRTLSLAWVFRDANLLFSSEVAGTSRFVFRRQVKPRLSAIAPFLTFTGEPYPVVHRGRVVWIVEGYTSTRHFPLGSARDLQRGRSVSYLRNSVKAVVDGVTGEVSFYAVDTDDPLLEAYSRAFPGLFRPLEELPAGLREHLRYPQEMLELQSQVLNQYHQETAPRFHGQQDVWAIPQELAQGPSPVTYRPEYGIYRLPGEEEEEFLLSTVFVPVGRQNLTGWLVARSDREHYGELRLYDIPVEEQAPGPRQVEALVEQDPTISQQFSLWRQGGSRVWSGHLHLAPADSTFVYMEAVFLAAEEDAIPELRRFVVSDGRSVTMEPTLSGAVAVMAGEQVEEGPSRPAPSPAAQETDPTTRWPQEALDLLDRAESRLRDGDYEGFGQALSDLRALLRQLSGGGA